MVACITRHMRGETIGLTGRCRYRLQKRWLRKTLKVLQVEEEYWFLTLIRTTETKEKRTIWRDWQIEDEVFMNHLSCNITS